MGKKRGIALLVSGLLMMASLSAYAEEELFDTKTSDLHIEQGLAFLKAKNYDAAVREFEESAEINPDAEAYYYLGYTYYLKSRKGDQESREKSRENFEQAYEIDPNFSPTRLKPTETIPEQQVQQQEAQGTPTPTPEPVTQPTVTAPAPEAQPAQPTTQPSATAPAK